MMEKAVNAQAGVNGQPGLIDTVKEKIGVDSIAGYVRTSRERIIDICLAAGIGFLFGFFLRKYSTYVALLILIGIAVSFLNYYGVLNIAIDWTRAQEVLGVQQIQFNDGGILSFVFEWIKANIVISISLGVGFLIGLRVG